MMRVKLSFSSVRVTRGAPWRIVVVVPVKLIACVQIHRDRLWCEMVVVCRRVTGSEGGEEESNRPAVSGRRDDTGIGWCLEPIAVSPFVL